MFEDQIARGVKLLDEKMPGWLDEIDVDKLDLECEMFPTDPAYGHAGPKGCGCVLAQIDHARADEGRPGDYFYRAMKLGLTTAPQSDDEQHASRYGFTVPASFVKATSMSAFHRAVATLTDEWKATIQRLRAERGKE